MELNVSIAAVQRWLATAAYLWQVAISSYAQCRHVALISWRAAGNMTGNSSHNWTSSSTTRNDVKTYTIRHRYVNSPTQTLKLIAVICTWMYAGILIGCIEFFCHFITKRCPSIITSAMVRGGWLFSLLLCASVCQQHVSEMSTNSGEIFQGWGMWRSGLLRFFAMSGIAMQIQQF